MPTPRIHDDLHGRVCLTHLPNSKPIEDAIEVLEAGGTISSALANSLSAKLGAAMHQVDHQPHAAANMLTAFVHQVTALVRTGRLSVADGTNLITAAQNLIADLAN